MTFYPTGNADTCLIECANGRKVIYDFADQHNANDSTDKRIDLEKEVRAAVGDEKRIDVLAISHLDLDHYQRSSEVFWLDHAEKYQGGDRIKFDTLWVPVAAIVETGITDEGKVLRAEARHRLKEGAGIRVFGRAKLLDNWLNDAGIDPEDRADLITDAGSIVPGFSLGGDGLEFFVHSPFAMRDTDGNLIDRNSGGLFMQATFVASGTPTRLLLTADCDHETLEAIIGTTRHHGNDARLEWDLNNIPHHCSYLSLAAEKGTDQTVPTADIDWLYAEQGTEGGTMVSTSKPIPTNDADKMPPHRQAASYYRSIARALNGDFRVTMEHPTKSAPKPMVFEIGANGPQLKKPLATPSIAATTHRPRAGSR